MIQTVEHEVINNEIAKMLSNNMSYSDIAKELHVGNDRICNIVYSMGLGQRDRKAPHKTHMAKEIPAGNGNTLEDIRKANPYKVGDKVIVKDKNGSDTTKAYKCVVEKITDYIVFARGENGRMYTVAFPVMGMDSRTIVRR